jgi:hypothetical protein
MYFGGRGGGIALLTSPNTNNGVDQEHESGNNTDQIRQTQRATTITHSTEDMPQEPSDTMNIADAGSNRPSMELMELMDTSTDTVADTVDAEFSIGMDARS